MRRWRGGIKGEAEVFERIDAIPAVLDVDVDGDDFGNRTGKNSRLSIRPVLPPLLNDLFVPSCVTAAVRRQGRLSRDIGKTGPNRLA